MGLGKGYGYDYFMTLIDVLPTHQLTVDYVVTRMLNEEARSEEKGSTCGNEVLMANIAKRRP